MSFQPSGAWCKRISGPNAAPLNGVIIAAGTQRLEVSVQVLAVS